MQRLPRPWARRSRLGVETAGAPVVANHPVEEGLARSELVCPEGAVGAVAAAVGLAVLGPDGAAVAVREALRRVRRVAPPAHGPVQAPPVAPVVAHAARAAHRQVFAAHRHREAKVLPRSKGDKSIGTQKRTVARHDIT